MTLLAIRRANPDPVRTVLFQFISCVCSSAMFGWVGILGGYSLWPPALMHCVWNRVNPWLLGEWSSGLQHTVLFECQLVL